MGTDSLLHLNRVALHEKPVKYQSFIKQKGPSREFNVIYYLHILALLKIHAVIEESLNCLF
uniref:Uncharacterized protein n=1 Tax=Heterorhabditis bacteriophora TaxID=37862 RepID=A0A1I7WG18_HETBA